MAETGRDLGIPEDFERAYLHLGRITSLANSIDLRLLQWGTWLACPSDPDSVRESWAAKSTANKLAVMGRLLPSEWHDGPRLLDGVKRAFRYRNDVVHASVHFEFAPPERNPIWSWLAVDRAGVAKELPMAFDAFEICEQRFAVVEACLSWLVHPGIAMVRDGVLDLATLDLTTQLAEIGVEPLLGETMLTTEWLAAVHWVLSDTA